MEVSSFLSRFRLTDLAFLDELPSTHRSREEWSMLLEGLSAAGYDNSLDLEIICPAEGIEIEDGKGGKKIRNY